MMLWHVLCSCEKASERKNTFEGGNTMKKTMITLGALMLVAAVAYPVLAWGPGKGGRYQGMGWGHGPGSCWNNNAGSGYGALNQEQAKQLNQLRQNFHNDTAPIRNELRNKQWEFTTEFNANEPDRAKLATLQGEINDLRAKLSLKRLGFRLDARKIAPNAMGIGKGHWQQNGGRGERGMVGSGYGPGYGYHRGGFSGGPCWN
jgi:zinc resistance-associated protein